MKRCPIDFRKPVDGLLGAGVRDRAKFKELTNLGWLIRNGVLVEQFDLYPHPPVVRGYTPDFYLVARLSDGRTYETGFSCYSVFQGRISRSRTLRDVQVNIHPQLAKRLKKR